MMYRLWMFLRRIYPRFDYLKDEQVVLAHHFPVDDFAFEIGVALVYKRCLYVWGCRGRETEFPELVDLASGITLKQYPHHS